MSRDQKFVSKETEDKKIELEKIGPGDIVFEVEIHPTSGTLVPIHSWIHVSSEPEMAHAVSMGKKLIAATRHTITRYVVHAPSVVMLRPINEKLKKLIIQVGERFTPILNETDLNAAAKLKLEPNNEAGTIPLVEAKVSITPYSLIRQGDNIQELNAFRAVRAALRSGLTTDEKLFPLSKKKGVSCDEFVGYTIQSALVILLLGNKVNELQSLVKAISAARRKNDSGLKAPATELLKIFYKKFIDLSETHSQLPSEIKKQEVLNIISSPIKGYKIKNSLPFWLGSSLFEKTVGAFSLDDLRKIVDPKSFDIIKNEPKKLLGFEDGEQASDGEESDHGWYSDEVASVQGDTKSEGGSDIGKQDAFAAIEALSDQDQDPENDLFDPKYQTFDNEDDAPEEKQPDQAPELKRIPPQKALFNPRFFPVKDDLALLEKKAQTPIALLRSKSFSE